MNCLPHSRICVDFALTRNSLPRKVHGGAVRACLTWIKENLSAVITYRHDEFMPFRSFPEWSRQLFMERHWQRFIVSGRHIVTSITVLGLECVLGPEDQRAHLARCATSTIHQTKIVFLHLSAPRLFHNLAGAFNDVTESTS